MPLDLATIGEFHVQSALGVPWGPETASGTDPDAAPGEKGGPLRLTFTANSYGYTLGLSGWLVITGIGAEPPPLFFGAPPEADTPGTPGTETAATGSTSSAVPPRFTG